MIGSFFRKPKPAVRRAASVPDGAVVWAVGDVHGRADLLLPLLTEIVNDLRATKPARPVVVMLGDYIDRGADSRGVIDLLCRLSDVADIETHFLRGNHEERFEAFLTEPELGPSWCEYGGREALLSYGVTIPALKGDGGGWVEASANLNAALPDSHRKFLARQLSSFEIGDYFFAHAGARPGIALAEQSEQDLMWIRGDFLSQPHRLPCVVVHGHTPDEQPFLGPDRINIDTGAYATGVLTAVRLIEGPPVILQARKSRRV